MSSHRQPVNNRRRHRQILTSPSPSPSPFTYIYVHISKLSLTYTFDVHFFYFGLSSAAHLPLSLSRETQEVTCRRGSGRREESAGDRTGSPSLHRRLHRVDDKLSGVKARHPAAITVFFPPLAFSSDVGL